MLFRDISMIDENMAVRTHMYVGTEGTTITYVSSEPPTDATRFGEVYPHSAHRLLVPGFVNAHAHSPMYLLRGYAENLSLQEWLGGKIFPFEAKINSSDIYNATLCGIAEMLRFGTVSATDMYYSGMEMCKAYSESGMKGCISVCCICTDEREYRNFDIYKEALDMVSAYPGGRVRAEFSLHAEYTSTERVARALAEAAKEAASSIHVHVSETGREVAECRARHDNLSPIEYLARCGIFDVPATAAHCVQKRCCKAL